MDTRFEEVVCLIKNGIDGELVVNEKGYNKPMKGITILTELEIAEITTYLYNNWDRKRGIVEVREINSALGVCPKQ